MSAIEMLQKRNEAPMTVMKFEFEGQIVVTPEAQVLVEPLVVEMHEEKGPSLLKSQGGDG